MRYICLSISICLCLTLQAAIIVTFSGEPIRDVTIIAVSDHEVTFVNNSEEFSIPYEQVEAIMYDDGRYVTLQHNTQIIVEEESTSSKDSIHATEREMRRQELKQAFDKAGSAMKSAFSTLFNKKKKDESNSPTVEPSTPNDEPAPYTNTNEDNW